MSDLPKEWEAIRGDVQLAHVMNPEFRGPEAIRAAVERCYALHTKPKRELTDAELSKAYSQATIGTDGTHIAGLRGVEAAVWAKQREPETVTFGAARRIPDGGVAMFQVPCSGLPNENWEWLEPAQTIEVVVP